MRWNAPLPGMHLLLEGVRLGPVEGEMEPCNSPRCPLKFLGFSRDFILGQGCENSRVSRTTGPGMCRLPGS
jgi:hypothetical protein